jgi:hypothetical protein
MRAIQSICLMFMMMLVSYAAPAAESGSTTLTGEGWTIETQGRTQAAEQDRSTPPADTACEVAAYYWPNWHADARNEAKLGKGWTEWEMVKAAKPRFPGHMQPRVPLWGYEDEADPKVMARKIDAAADHGITAFIFDWYYFERGIALERCLHEGFLQAPNRERIKFAIMWANCDYVDLFPAKIGKPKALWDAGTVTRETFVKATDLMIDRYFSQPNYMKVNGLPYFSIYELHTLMKGLGGAEQTRLAFADFRKRCRRAGLPGVHINATSKGVRLDTVGKEPFRDPVSPDKPALNVKDEADLLAMLGINSVTTYVWIDCQPIPEFPSYPYEKFGDAAVRQWPDFQARFKVPYYPNVTVGWDSTPRTDPSQEFKRSWYPHYPVLVDATPAAFKKYLQQAKLHLASQPADQRILTINAWNEWTEGSYLEPDTRNKMEYLEAVRSVFPPGNRRPSDGQGARAGSVPGAPATR